MAGGFQTGYLSYSTPRDLKYEQPFAMRPIQIDKGQKMKIIGDPDAKVVSQHAYL
jgi:hypothetical protein